MNLLTFPDWQKWENLITVGVIAIIAVITALLLVKAWGASVTQWIDILIDVLRVRIIGLIMLGALFVGALFLIPRSISQSTTTLANLWPTATPVPTPTPPLWYAYFPLAMK